MCLTQLFVKKKKKKDTFGLGSFWTEARKLKWLISNRWFCSYAASFSFIITKRLKSHIGASIRADKWLNLTENRQTEVFSYADILPSQAKLTSV